MDDLDRLKAENARLREQIERAEQWYWREDETDEIGASDPDAIFSNEDPGCVVGVSCGGILWTRYYAWLPAADGTDDDFVVDAETQEEAERLVKAERDRRAALNEGGEHG